MSLLKTIETIVVNIINRRRKVNNVCEVVSVDKAKNTCELKDSSGFVVKDARLLAVIDDFDKKFVVYPKVGSNVSISYLFDTGDKAIITSYSEIDEILVGGNEFGGLVKVEDLKTELGKLSQYVTSLKQSTQTALVALDALIPGTSGAFVTSMAGKTTGDFSAIQNEKVKHG